MTQPAWVGKVREIVGRENLLDAPEDLVTHSYDGTPMLEKLPVAVAIPRSTEDVSRILKLANEAPFNVVPRGAGSGLSGGSVPVENSLVLLMTRWNRILEIDEKNLAAWAEPGVITAQFHKAVEARGLFYPPDPSSMNVCTLGGNVAENSGGLRCLKYGMTKPYVLGLEAVLPTGDVVKCGGKVTKDVAGYDLKDWFVGSEGSLGVFTKILLKLVPKPETSRTLLAWYPRLVDCAETVSALIAAKITPSILEFLDRTTIRCVEDYAKIGLPTDLEAILLLEADGRAPVVEEDARRAEEICRRGGASFVKVAKDEAEAMQLKQARRGAFSALARVRPTTVLEDVTVPRSEIAPMVVKIQEIAKKNDVVFGNFGHAGDGNLHPTCLIDERIPDEVHRAEKAFDEIFNLAIDMGGTITGEHGTGLAKKKFLPRQFGEAGVEMMRRIKSVLDPNGILNPGKIFNPKPRCEGSLPKTREQAALIP